MKRFSSIRDKIDYGIYLPGEVWRLILESVPFRAVIRLTCVSWAWRKLIYESVRQFDGYESDGLRDEHLTRFVSLQRIDLSKRHGVIANRVTDQGLKGLTALTSLKLDAGNVISDAGIENLCNLSSLVLGKNRTVTNGALVRLSKLISLDLRGNRVISDQGISGLSHLKSLYLDQNDVISDCGIQSLTNLTFLSINYQRMGNITDAGISLVGQLKNALPGFYQ